MPVMRGMAQNGPAGHSDVSMERVTKYAGRRDPRLVAAHRGGLLDKARHYALAQWAADCAEHVLPLFVARHPDDDRPDRAIAAARAWAAGNASAGQARQAAIAAHAAARGATDESARAAARAAGHAAATAHMGDHALGAAAYSVKAAALAAPAIDAAEAEERESRWQRDRLPENIRELVLHLPAVRLKARRAGG